MTAVSYRPSTPQAVPRVLVDAILAQPHDRPIRVAVDGPACAGPERLADAMAELLRPAGREPIVIHAPSYWRDASLRLEFGHTDVDSYFEGWLDRPALEREVLTPLGPGGDRRYLPALRDPTSNRSVRVAYRTAADNAVLLLSGDLLLGCDLPFDRSIHLAVSASARRRRTAPDRAWTLPALERYDRDVGPGSVADAVISWNDPARPAIRC